VTDVATVEVVENDVVVSSSDDVATVEVVENDVVVTADDAGDISIDVTETVATVLDGTVDDVTISVTETTAVITEATTGPQGPQGPQGIPGSSVNYVHTQSTASATWSVTHGLGKYCSVTVVDSSNTTVIGEVIYQDANTTTISFGSAFTGKAFFN